MLSQPEPTELAWAAGFFDGEGCTSVHRTAPHVLKSLTVVRYRYPRLQVSQVDSRSLFRLLAVLDVGVVRGPYKKKNPRARPQSKWYAVGPNAIAAMELMWPYLGDAKREQYLRVMGECADSREEIGEALVGSV